jgi:hypothetical protein
MYFFCTHKNKKKDGIKIKEIDEETKNRAMKNKHIYGRKKNDHCNFLFSFN